MSELETSAAEAAVTRDARIRRIAWMALAVVVIVAPLSQVVLILVSPSNWNDADPVTHLYGHVDSYAALSWLGQLTAVTLAPAAIAVGLLAMRRAPLLGLAGMVLIVPGLLNADGNPEDVIYGAGRAGIPLEQARAAYGYLTDLPANGTFGYYAYYLAFVAGGLILGVALITGRTVPRWAGGCLVASSVIGLVGAVADLGVAGPLAAWLLVTLAFAACARSLVHAEQP